LLHFLPTGYDPIRNAVSDYGVGRYRIWHRIAVVSLAAAGFATAIASTGTIRPEPGSVIAFLTIFALARILIPLFPTDVEGQPHTRTGRVHWVLAITAFASLATAAGFFKGTGLDDVVGLVVVSQVIVGSDVTATDDSQLHEAELKTLRKGFAMVTTSTQIFRKLERRVQGS
jgi:hypothetical protein